MAGDQSAQLGTRLARRHHRIAGAIMLRSNGCAFGVQLIEHRIICERQTYRNVPIVWMISYRVRPDFVVDKQTLLFEFVVHRLQIVAKILPECVALAWLEGVMVDAPYWP